MYLNSCNMGAMSREQLESEIERMTEEMRFIESDIVAKSGSMYGMLEALRQPDYMDIHEVFNSKKAGLDYEFETIKNGWFNAKANTDMLFDHWYPKYKEIHAKFVAMYNLLNKVSSNPKQYREQYKTTDAWSRFLDMTLVQAADAATRAAGKAGSNLLMSAIPIVGIALLAYWAFKKI